MRRPWPEKGKRDGAVAIGLSKEMDAWCIDGDMNRHCDGFQVVGYRKVTSCVNEGGVRVQTRRSKRRGDGN
jgi:hypothetical protein